MTFADIYTVSYINKRHEQQDSFYWAEFTTGSTHTEGMIAALFDGMGGLENGADASSLAVSEIRSCVQRGDVSQSSLINGLKKANDYISDFEPRAGSTADVLRLYEGTYTILHLGDSRVYRFPYGSCHGSRLTKDDSAISHFRSQGIKITPEVLKKYAGQVTRGLGRVPWTTPTVYTGTYSSGDAFLLCSDGFWNCFDSSGSQLPSFDQSSLDSVLNSAPSFGETDNMTAVLVVIR